MASSEPGVAHGLPAEKDEEAEVIKAKLDKTTKVLSAGVFMHLLAMSFTWGARDNMALERTGSAANAATFLARIDGIGALVEFLLNPVFGKLSDAYGRKPFIANASLGTCLTSALVVQQGTLFSLLMDKFLTTPLNTSFFTIFRAALTDLLSKSKSTGEFAARNAQISAFAGLAIIMGPILGGKIRTTVSARGRSGDRAAFIASSLMALVNCIYLAKNFEETLPEGERCELTRDTITKDMQPLSFTQVWGTSPAINKMFWAEGFQTLAEPRNISPVQYLLLTQDFGWDMSMFANALAGFGVSLVFGGILAKKQLEFMGLRMFTTVCNICNSSALALQGCGMVIERNLGVRTPLTWALSIMFLIPGARKRDGIEGALMLLGDEAGFGRGFMSGAMMNWRAVFNVITPVVLGYIYAWGKSNGRNAPYLPWIVGAVSNLVAEGVLQTLSNRDLFLDDQGNTISRSKSDVKDASE